MPDSKVTSLASLASGSITDATKSMVVDVADTTMASSGTNKQTTFANIAQSPVFTTRYRGGGPIDATSFTWNGNTYSVVADAAPADTGVVTVNSTRAVSNWAAMQALADKIGMERRQAILPAGVIQIDGPIVLPKSDSWAISGQGKSTAIQQNRSDCEIFDIGSLGKFFMGGAASYTVALVDGSVVNGDCAGCTSSTTTTLTVSGTPWTTDKWVGRRLTYIVSGTKYRARITANTTNTLTFADEITGGAMPVAPSTTTVDGYEYIIGAQGVNVQSGELYANNTVAFSTTGYSWGQHITGIRFTYAAEQTTSVTRSACIRLSTEIFWGSFRDLVFCGGNWGIQLNNNVGTPWSYDFDEIDFSAAGAVGTVRRISRGAIDFCASNYGTSGPAQRWGRVGVNIPYAVGDTNGRIIILRGGITMDNIEYYDIKQPVSLFYLVAGSADIKLFKFENVTMSSLNTSLVELSNEANTYLHIGYFYAFQSGSGSGISTTNEEVAVLRSGQKYVNDNLIVVDNMAFSPISVSGTWKALPICKTGYPIDSGGNRSLNGNFGNSIRIGRMHANKIATTTTGSNTLSGTYTLNVASTSGMPWTGSVIVNGDQYITYNGYTSTTLTNCSGGTGTFAAGTIVKLNTGFVLTRPSTTIKTGDTNSLSGGIGVWCDDWANDRISLNKGDANYIFTLGEPTNVRFETALTASRTITIPDKAQDGLFDGFSIRITAQSGVVNGSNTLVIKAGATTLQTISSGTLTTRVEYTWRSNDNTGGTWLLTNQQTF